MKLWVGLGNPGAKYAGNRHNIGFMALDRIAADHGFSAWRSKFQGEVAEGLLAGGKVLLLKPMTYMNLSGTSVAEALRFYKLDATRDLLVIVDDIALPCGGIRLRGEGSAGGHNGLSDIQAKLGTDRYARCRIGIDAPGQIPQRDYVLGRFREDQQPLVDDAIKFATEAAECWISKGLTEAMNRFNRRTGEADAAKPARAQRPESKKPESDKNSGPGQTPGSQN